MTVKDTVAGHRGLEDELNKVNDLLAKAQSDNGLSLSDVNKVKRMMDNNVSMYTQMGLEGS